MARMEWKNYPSCNKCGFPHDPNGPCELERPCPSCEALRASLAAANRRIEGLEKVATYADHGAYCNTKYRDVMVMAGECTCGLDAALAALGGK